MHRDGKEIANLICDPETVYIDGLGRLELAKNHLGYVWNSADEVWAALPVGYDQRQCVGGNYVGCLVLRGERGAWPHVG